MNGEAEDPITTQPKGCSPRGVEGTTGGNGDGGDNEAEDVNKGMPLPAAGLPNRPGPVQRLLEKEGHEARNVVSWLVPNRMGGGGLLIDARSGSSGRQGGERGERDSREPSRERDHSRRKSPLTSPFRSSNGSASSSKGTPNWRGGRGGDPTALGFNQRLWGYLFRNVNRAVDELYYLCEAEGSATHCQEAAELLESCGRDFNKLVERIADQSRFEEEQRAARAAENSCLEREGESHLEAGRKPKGLVWEVRKTTSAAGASAIVLSVIERMESQSQCASNPSTTAAATITTTGTGSAAVTTCASPSTRDPEPVLDRWPPTISTGGGPCALPEHVSREDEARQKSRQGKSQAISTAARTRNGGRMRAHSAELSLGLYLKSSGGQETATTDSAAGGVATDSGDLRAVGGDAVKGTTMLLPSAADVGSDVVSGVREPGVHPGGGQPGITAGTTKKATAFNRITNDKNRKANEPDGEVPEQENPATVSASAREKMVAGHPSEVGGVDSDIDAPKAGLMEYVHAGRDEETQTAETDVACGRIDADVTATGTKDSKVGGDPAPMASDKPYAAASEDDGSTVKGPGSVWPVFHPSAAIASAERRGGDGSSVAGVNHAACIKADGDGRTSSQSSQDTSLWCSRPNPPSQGAAVKASRLNPRAAPFTYTAPAGKSSAAKDAARGGGGTGENDKDSTQRGVGKIGTVEDARNMSTRVEGQVSLTDLAMVSAQGVGEERDRKHQRTSAVQTREPRTSVDGTPVPLARAEDTGPNYRGIIVVEDEKATGGAKEVGATGAIHVQLTPESKWSRRPELTLDGPKKYPFTSGSLRPSTTSAAEGGTAVSADTFQKITVQKNIGAGASSQQQSGGQHEPMTMAPGDMKTSAPSTGRGNRRAEAFAAGFKDRCRERSPDHYGVRFASGGSVSGSSGGRRVGEFAGGRCIGVGRREESDGDDGRSGADITPEATERKRASNGAGHAVDSPKQQQEREWYAGDGNTDTLEKSVAGHAEGDRNAGNVGDGGGECRIDRDVPDCCDEADADSAYVTAMEQIWAEAEALVDAEAQAEEEAWARLPTDVPCPPESEGVPSDADEACRSGRVPPISSGGRAGCEEETAHEGADLHHTVLEIEIPTCDEEILEDTERGGAETAGGSHKGPPGKGQSIVSWYRKAECDHDHADTCTGTDDDEEEEADEEEDEEENYMDDGEEDDDKAKEQKSGRMLRCKEGGGDNACHTPSSSGSLGRVAGRGRGRGSGGVNPPPSEGSGASYFGNDRGSCETFDEGWVPFSHRELQKKLSSPQRKPQRELLTAAEAKRRQERRQMVAELNRALLASGMAKKLKQHEERAKGVRFRKEEQIIKAEEEARRKMEGADARRREHRRGIVRKANDANSKVEEVLFMNKLTVEDLKITLQMKIAEVDRRIQSGRERRQQLLAGISDRQRKRTKDKAAQMSERRLEAESAAAMRWTALQKRLEAVQERRRDRARETRRRMQAADRHHRARERREAMLQSTAAEGRMSGNEAAADRQNKLAHSSRKHRTAIDRGGRIGGSSDEGGHNEHDRRVPEDAKKELHSGDVADMPRDEDRSHHVVGTPTVDARNDTAGDLAVAWRKAETLEVASTDTDVHNFPSPGIAVYSADAIDDDEPLLPALGTPRTGVGELVRLPASASLASPPPPSPPPAPGKRGRAQKKRARKLRAKMREMCMDFVMARVRSPVAATVAALATKSISSRTGDASFAEMSSGQLGTRKNDDTCGGEGDDGKCTGEEQKPATTSPRTKLDRVAQDLARLESARASHRRREAGMSVKRGVIEMCVDVARGGRADEDPVEASSSCALAEDHGRGRNAGIESPSLTAERPSAFSAGNNTVAVDEHVAGSPISSLLKVLPAGARTVSDPTSTVDRDSTDNKGSEKEHTNDVLRQGLPQLPVGETSSLLTQVENLTEDDHSSVEQAAVPKVSVVIDTAATNLQNAQHFESQKLLDPCTLEAMSEITTAPMHGRKKTRRGKRAGGAINRRRGAKERAAGRAQDVSSTAAIVSSTHVANTVADTAPNRQEDATPSERSGETRQGVQATKIGSTAEGVSVGVGGRGYVAESATSPDRGSAVLSLPALEHAALRSVRDLLIMLISSTSSAAAVSEKGQGGRASLLSSTVHSGATLSAKACLQTQLRHRGILESLVVLCAPLPWSPVRFALQGCGRHFSTTSPSSSLLPLPSKEAHVSPTDEGTVTLSEDSRCEATPRPPVSGPVNPHNVDAEKASRAAAVVGVCAKKSGEKEQGGAVLSALRKHSTQPSSRVPASPARAPATPVENPGTPTLSIMGKGHGRAVADAGSRGGNAVVADCGRRELLIALVLCVLGEALEEPRNREYVLGMDGAAPLIDCLSRLIERAVRHEDAPSLQETINTSTAVLASAPGGVNYLERRGRGGSPKDLGRDGSSSSSRKFRRESGPVSADSVRPDASRIMDMNDEGLEALRTGLNVVALLLTHVPLSAACARIQEEVVRYLLAKRILTDMSCLVSIGKTLACRNETPASTGATTIASPKRFFLSSADRPSARPSPRPAGPRVAINRLTAARAAQHSMHDLAGDIADLFDAVVSLPLRIFHHSDESHKDEVCEKNVRGTGDGCRVDGGKRHGDALAAPSCDPGVGHRRKECIQFGFMPAQVGVNGDTGIAASGGDDASSTQCSGGGVIVHVEEEEEKRSAGSVVCCRRLEDLSNGTPLANRCGGPAFCAAVAPGGGRLIVAFISFLASMVRAEEHTGRFQRREGGTGAGAKRSFVEGLAQGVGDTPPLSDDLLALAFKIFGAINHAAVVNLRMVQECLSVEGVRLDFALLCDHLLAAIVHRLDPQYFRLLETTVQIVTEAATGIYDNRRKELESPSSSPRQPEMWLEAVLRLLGYFCLGNRKHQEVLQMGPPPTILFRLCNLPFRYFSESRYLRVLFPTLIAICYQNVRNRDVAENDLATEALADFLRQHLKVHGTQLPINKEPAGSDSDPSSIQEPTTSGVLLSHRLPLEMWKGAIEFFTPTS